MAIIIDEKTTVLVQGITGRTGEFATRLMVEYGTKVVAGVTPGRGGEQVWGVPVYNTVKEAIEEHGPMDMSATFVPAPLVKNAALEALDAGIKTLVMPVERVPLHDILEIIARAKEKNARVIGPGTLGIISPGKALCGWIGGAKEVAEEAFKPGHVGVISRSGGQTSTVSWTICREGLGISTAVHTGTEVVVGTTAAEYLELFEKDPETDLVVMFGEIGGVMESEAAEVIKEGRFTKPLVVYIAGRSLPSGIRFSHASAFIQRGRDTAESKERLLKEAGAYVVNSPLELALTSAKILKR
ncbi:MAG: CoA-binding protein [Candidatus Nezhaarchaeales archaeon]